MWKNLKCEYIGDLLNEIGEWKDITDFSIEAVSTSTVRRLTVNLKEAKAFIDHYYPKQARTDAPKDTSFFIETQKIMMKIPPISRKRVSEHCLHLALQQPAVKGECYWKLYKPIWTSLYQYPTDSKDGDIAWRLLHNTVVTPRNLYQWEKRKRKECPWCDGVSGTIEHMFLESQHATRL
jgi:hypothetical protein